MDYNDKINLTGRLNPNTSNPFKTHMRALFKWQWDMIRADRSMDQPHAQ